MQLVKEFGKSGKGGGHIGGEGEGVGGRSCLATTILWGQILRYGRLLTFEK